MKALILILGLLGTPALAADQFDLVCKGQERYSVVGRWKPASYRYRIDLQSLRWCSGTCDGTSKIEDVSDGVITLSDKKREPFNSSTETHWIGRRKGDLHYAYSSGPGLYEEREAQCEPAEFTGFPEPVRKF